MDIVKSCVVLAIVFLLSVVGCGEGQNEGDDDNPPNPEGTIEALVWETTGGGDARFIIEKINDYYEIRVERIEGDPVDITIPLSQDDLEVYSQVDDIFKAVIDLHDYTYTSVGETGTWTTITLQFSDDATLEVGDIDPSSELNLLYHFVRENPALD